MNINITPDIYFILFLALSICIHIIFPILIFFYFPFNLFGILLLVIGFSIILWVNFNLLKNKTSTQPFDLPSSLITSGLFKISRNPLYLGMAIFFFGIDIILGSLSPIFLTLAFIFCIDRFIIPIEEKNLEKIFKIEYLNYKKKVRRWI